MTKRDKNIQAAVAKRVQGWDGHTLNVGFNAQGFWDASVTIGMVRPRVVARGLGVDLAEAFRDLARVVLSVEECASHGLAAYGPGYTYRGAA